MKKSNLIMIVVTISMFVVLLLGATYAYFASNTTTGNGLDMTITTDDNNIAFAATEGTLSMHVKAEDMLQSQTGQGDVLAAETVGEDNIMITLSTNTETPIACTYNVYFQWNTNGAYTKTSGAEKELTLELNLEDKNGTGSEGANKFSYELQLTNAITNTNKTLIVENAYIIGSSTVSGTQTWIPTVRFYNLNKDQSALAGKTFGGKFTVEDVDCTVSDSSTSSSIDTNTLSGKVISQTNEREYISSQNTSKYIIKQETVEYNGEILDAGIRYEGANPNNYVQFNGGEEWRIIGVFEGSTIGLEPGKQYTKIIKSSSQEKIPWDMCDSWNDIFYQCDDPTESLEADWINSSLNAYLNGTYLESLLDKDKIAKYNENYSTWYLRGKNTYKGDDASGWFILERKNGALYADEPTTQSAIALMYASDYGYAAYGSDCDKSLALEEFYGKADEEGNLVSECGSVDWLNSSSDYEWLLAPASSTIAYDIYVYEGGEIGGGALFANFIVRPTLYLEHDIVITGGDGSKANPYILS